MYPDKSPRFTAEPGWGIWPSNTWTDMMFGRPGFQDHHCLAVIVWLRLRHAEYIY